MALDTQKFTKLCTRLKQIDLFGSEVLPQVRG